MLLLTKKVKYISERTLALYSKNSTFWNMSCLAPQVFWHLRTMFLEKNLLYDSDLLCNNWKWRIYCWTVMHDIVLWPFRWRHHVHSVVVQPFCKIGKMGGTLWNLCILVAMAKVPPLAAPMVVVGAISRYLALSAALLLKHINCHSWA